VGLGIAGMKNDETSNPQPSGALAINLGLIANVFLAVAKTAIGILGHSKALLADGVNSISDVTYYIVVKVFMKLADRPADDDHPYGHRQWENIAALMVGSFVITTGIAIFWDAVNNLYDYRTQDDPDSPIGIIAFWVALFTVVLKIGLTLYTRRAGRRTGNPAIAALAFDHRNDVFSATGTCLGILLAWSGLPWADPLVGAGVALLVFRTGLGILRDSSDSLMDTVPGNELARQVSAALQGVAGIRRIEECLAHRFGPYLVVNLTIGIDGRMTVAEGDTIASRVEDILTEKISFLRRVHVHCHPADKDEVAPRVTS